MHGQKKRRKRRIGERAVIDGFALCWELISEPQFTTEHGYRGLRIEVRMEEGAHRELILEYPFPRKKPIEVGGRSGSLWPGFRLRPKMSATWVEDDIRHAMAAGWNPQSRGKPRVFLVPWDLGKGTQCARRR